MSKVHPYEKDIDPETDKRGIIIIAVKYGHIDVHARFDPITETAEMQAICRRTDRPILKKKKDETNDYIITQISTRPFKILERIFMPFVDDLMGYGGYKTLTPPTMKEMKTREALELKKQEEKKKKELMIMKEETARKKLEAAGIPPEVIERIIAANKEKGTWT